MKTLIIGAIESNNYNHWQVIDEKGDVVVNVHIDKNIGVSGAKTHWMKSKDGKLFWCRQAIAIMGSFNMPIEEIERISPFDPNFNGNYIEGKGKTKEEALAKMQKDGEEISDSLWMI